MRIPPKPHLSDHRDLDQSNVKLRRAIGYVRVSTDMQAAEGLSLDAQTAAIEQYCTLHGLRLQAVCKDVISGATDQRPGLQEALEHLQRNEQIADGRNYCRLCDPAFELRLVGLRIEARP